MIKAGRSVEFRGTQYKSVVMELKKVGHNG